MFHKSIHLWVYLVDFHPWYELCLTVLSDYKSAIAFEQFCLLNPLLQSCLQKTTFALQSPKWLSLTKIPQLQLWSLCWGHLSTLFYTSATIWLICQMLHNIQEKFIKETNLLWGFHLILFNLARWLCLSLAQVSSLWIMILTRRMLPLLILLLVMEHFGH